MNKLTTVKKMYYDDVTSILIQGRQIKSPIVRSIIPYYPRLELKLLKTPLCKNLGVKKTYGFCRKMPLASSEASATPCFKKLSGAPMHVHILYKNCNSYVLLYPSRLDKNENQGYHSNIPSLTLEYKSSFSGFIGSLSLHSGSSPRFLK